MTSNVFRTSSWHLATTLAERLAARRGQPQQDGSTGDRARAVARLRRWRSQLPFQDGEFFDLRLAADQLTEEELLVFLGETAESIPVSPGMPPWLTELEQAYSGRNDWPAVDLPAVWQDDENIGFLNIIAPLLARGRHRVQAGVRDLVARFPLSPIDSTTAEEILLGGLPGILQRMLARTLVLELNVARLRGQFAGETPQQRYASFVKSLCQADTALAILNEYPVLARQVVLIIDRWVVYSLEFLEHLARDWDTVRTILPGDEPGRLVAIHGNAGDTHRGGRAVLIARFESDARVVYKPKALAVDRHFLELLAWINDHVEGLPPFPIHKVLDQGTYGWVEFVEPHGCTTADEVHRFYQRQGGYLALLYALEATDFHSENLIAAGENPVLPDLEALFHPRGDVLTLAQARGDAVQAVEYSVMRVGMLPRRIWGSDDSAGIDISGLGATGGQITAYHVPQLEGTGTDEVRLVRKRIETRQDHNRPTLDETTSELADYTGGVVAGFETVYRLLQARREELLAPGGHIAAFAEDEIRVIIRETRTYTILLHESYHPDVLRDALDRDRLIDRLWVGIAGSASLGRVIPAERKDMILGDIPMFTTRANSHDLWAGPEERVADFFTASGMQRVEERLRSFDEHDLARQRWIIQATMATTAKVDPTRHQLTPVSTPSDREALLAAAIAIGERLESLALRNDRGASWLGVNYHARGHWTFGPLGLDLYNGLPGVALFLAYLGHITGESRFTILAQATTTTLQQANPAGVLGGNIGALEGWGGVLYTLTHLATLWDRSALLAGAKLIAAAMPPWIEKDEKLDLASGSAGCLAGLLCLHRVGQSESVLAAAVRCGERLLDRAQASVESAHVGLNWPPSLAARAPLTGFANGAAGIAWALLELADRTGDARFRRAAEQALAYERSLFSREAGNWPDFRTPAEGMPDLPPHAISWSHGATGIGLARLQALRRQDDPALRSEVEAAIRTARESGLGKNHTLGNGDLGILDLMLQAGELLGDPDLQAETARLTGAVLESIHREGWRCAAPRATETPGLMTGLAGIGMGLLRLAEPQRVPSVLVFAPPAF